MSYAMVEGDTVRWIVGDTASEVGATLRVNVLVKPTRIGVKDQPGRGDEPSHLPARTLIDAAGLDRLCVLGLPGGPDAAVCD